MAFYTYDFTCGNFTYGYGHYMGSSADPTRSIVENLERDGEKNCKVVFRSKTNHDDPRYTPSHTSTYQVTGRWHSSAFAAAASVVPFVLPAIVSKLSAKQ
jgi:hypothetical protein